MDQLVALILACSLHFDDHLVEALARKLSMSNQLFVGDFATLDTFESVRSVPDGRQVVDRITARGGRPAIGYMAVPVEWAARFGRPIDDLFDGCTNIAVATAMLSEYARACSAGVARPSELHRRPRRTERHPTRSLRYCVLRRLEIDLNVVGIADHVLPEIAKLEGAPPDPDVDPLSARSPLYPDNSDSSYLHDGSDWSSPRVFLSIPTVSARSPAPPRPAESPALDRRPSAVSPLVPASPPVRRRTF